MASFHAFAEESKGALLLVIGPLFLMLSCAGYTFTRFNPGSDETGGWQDDGPGYVIYEPHPYFLVIREPVKNAKRDVGKGEREEPDQAQKTEDVSMKTTVKLIWLPNRSRGYKVTTYTYLANLQFNLELTDGWMYSKSEAKSDTTAMLSALVEVAKAAAIVALVPDPSKPTFHLYRVAYGENGHPSGLVEVEWNQQWQK